MASTSQLLTWIELECHGWTRDGVRGTRPLFNEAHRLLMSHECEQNVVVDENTGDLPLLATTDSVYRYICPDNCWRTGGILVDEISDIGYEQRYANRQWQYEEYYFGSALYYKIKNIRQRDARQDTNANITFIRINPGTTTNTYKHLYWRLPVDISSDAVQHEVPEGKDLEFLVPATKKLIESIDNGKIIEARQYITQVLKPALWHELDSGEQGVSLYTRKRAY